MIRWNDLLDAGSHAEASRRGTQRLEGKTYVVQDGDVLNIRRLRDRDHAAHPRSQRSGVRRSTIFGGASSTSGLPISAYVTSFITIGGIWLVHHGIFRRLQYANSCVMLINLLLLMAVSFLPFPTKLLAEAIHEPDAERAAVIFYGAIAPRDLVPAQRPVGCRSRATATFSSRR